MNLKRIIALAGVVILALIYIATLISAIFTTPATPGLFKACVYATVIVPVLFYAYLLIYKVMKQRSEDARKEMNETFASDSGQPGSGSISNNANILDDKSPDR